MAASKIPQPTFEDFELLVRVSQLLTVINLDDVLREVITLMRDAVGAARASFFLQDQQYINWSRLLVIRDLTPDETFQVVNRVLNEGLAGWVVRNNTGAIVLDTRKDERWYNFPGDTRPVRSALCVPFIHDHEVLAVLTLEHPEPNHFTDYHLRMMTIVANQATVAIYNAQLFDRLQAKQQQLETVLYAIPEALFVLDADERVVMVNPAAAELLDTPDVQTPIGHPLGAFDGRSQFITGLLEALRKGGAAARSFSLRSDAHERDYEVTVSAWRDAKQNGQVVLAHDVTQLRDLTRFKDEMLRMASHDLRSPIAVIVGYADMIELDIPDGSPLVDFVRAVRLSAERVYNMLEGLLRVERIKNSPLELQQNIHLAALVKMALEGLRPAADSKQQMLVSSLALDDAPPIFADPLLIRQAMENLVSNAIKYTPAGGHITVHAAIQDGYFEFVVQDTGPGIPQSHLPNLYKPFYRVKSAETAAQPGAGVGLSLVKSVIERHRGEVWVESEVGVGSSFGFRLPLT